MKLDPLPSIHMREAEDLIILTRCSIRVGFLSGTGCQQIPSVPPCDSQTILSSQIEAPTLSLSQHQWSTHIVQDIWADLRVNEIYSDLSHTSP